MVGDALPEWVRYLAQDADGTWWGYEAHPNRHETGWYENEVGRCLRLGRGAPRPDWGAGCWTGVPARRIGRRLWI